MILRAFTAMTLVAVAWLLPSCSAGLGEFCWSDRDCAAGLRCSASGTYVDGDRGVCTYPDGIPDASAQDHGHPDLPADAGVEASLDQSAEAMNDSTTDLMLEGSPPDAPTPDVPTPDALTPDAPAPDALTPDALTPDAPAPDALTTDLLLIDQSNPDFLHQD